MEEPNSLPVAPYLLQGCCRFWLSFVLQVTMSVPSQDENLPPKKKTHHFCLFNMPMENQEIQIFKWWIFQLAILVFGKVWDFGTLFWNRGLSYVYNAPGPGNNPPMQTIPVAAELMACPPRFHHWAMQVVGVEHDHATFAMHPGNLPGNLARCLEKKMNKMDCFFKEMVSKKHTQQLGKTVFCCVDILQNYQTCRPALILVRFRLLSHDNYTP